MTMVSTDSAFGALIALNVLELSLIWSMDTRTSKKIKDALSRHIKERHKDGG